MSSEEPAIADRLLRSALEHAVKVAQVGSRRVPPEPFPGALRRFFTGRTLAASALATVRRAIETDDEFRRRVASVASSDLVDELGRVWLERAEGWQQRATELMGADGDDSSLAELRSAVRDEVRRRERAEQRRDSADRELESIRSRHDRQVGEWSTRVAELERRCDQLQRERDEAIGRARKAEARAAGAEQAAVTSESSSGDVEDRMAELRRRLEDAEGARDAALAEGAERRGDDIDQIGRAHV